MTVACHLNNSSFFSSTRCKSQLHQASRPSPEVLESVKTSIFGLISRASFTTASTLKGTYGNKSHFETTNNSLVKNIFWVCHPPQ